MFTPATLLPGAIADLYAQVSNSGEITLSDRYALMAAIFDESLSEEERYAIDRLLRAAIRGRLRFVDELSSAL